MTDPDDTAKMTVLPTAADEMRASLEASLRLAAFVSEVAPKIAKARKEMFDAHIAAGFSERQALELSTKFI